MEISLPDEDGRLQIMKIHTASMAKHGNLDGDVSLPELAHRSKNFSGVFISPSNEEAYADTTSAGGDQRPRPFCRFLGAQSTCQRRDYGWHI